MTHVLNPDGVLSAAAVDSIDAVLMRLDKHGIQGLVVAVHQVADADSYSFAIELGRRFGVGGEKNWGFVAVLANQDRLTQIVTGTGLEKFLPDVICYRIQERYMDSYLQHSDWDNAMCACVGAIEAYVMGNEEVSEYLNEEDVPDEDALPWLIPLGLVLGGAGALKWQSKKCPKCGKHKV
ncbi:MAG: TPM domain-containing protein, partial [Paludibacteraceae bacterium]|nr:TPM domain-containing protein [Paludibacteraceae bacterium]